MMRKSVPFIAVALGMSATVLVGCGSKQSGYKPVPDKAPEVAKVEPGNEAILFPLEKGKKWTYTWESTVRTQKGQISGSTEVTFTVKDLKDEGGVKTAFIEITDDKGKSIDAQGWVVDKTGIYQSSGGPKNLPFTPKQPMIVFPIEKGKSFKWNGKGPTPVGDMGSGEQESAFSGVENADILQGDKTVSISAYSYNSLAIFTTSKGKKGRQSSRSWWAPNRGLIRAQIEVEVDGTLQKLTLRLKEKAEEKTEEKKK